MHPPTTEDNSISVMVLYDTLHQTHNKHLVLTFNPSTRLNCCGLCH